MGAFTHQRYGAKDESDHHGQRPCHRRSVVGEGDEARAGQMVSVHYTGWLTDGTKFDSSKDRNEPFEFPLGARHVIAGWDEGVQGMKIGGTRKLTIPPSWATARAAPAA
jgi:FKBP-type peptidyl-prolyl cis-trans isomerase